MQQCLMLYMELVIPNDIKYCTELLYFTQLFPPCECAQSHSPKALLHAPPITLQHDQTVEAYTHQNSIGTRWRLTSATNANFSTIPDLTTEEWTHLCPHACYRLKWGTKRSARQCSIRWYQWRPSYSTMATNARRSILNLSRNLSRNFLSLKSQLLHNS
jgi:hypothetical protein